MVRRFVRPLYDAVKGPATVGGDHTQVEQGESVVVFRLLELRRDQLNALVRQLCRQLIMSYALLPRVYRADSTLLGESLPRHPHILRVQLKPEKVPSQPSGHERGRSGAHERIQYKARLEAGTTATARGYDVRP